MITLDNASNNGTMMEELERVLRAKGIRFSWIGNRIRSVAFSLCYFGQFIGFDRCFPHVINIAVQTGVRQLTAPPENSSDPYPDNIADEDPFWASNFDPEQYAIARNERLARDEIYCLALQADPIAQARNTVHASKASGRRREEFQDTIREGNKNKTFGEDSLPEAVLLLDVDTRWSSIYVMVDRVLELNQVIYSLQRIRAPKIEILTEYLQAIDEFLKRPNQESIAHLRLRQATLDLLQDIRQFLQAPHLVQEVLSVQKTPTLSMALPGYEKLLVLLRLLKRRLWRIEHAINASICKLEEYLMKAHENDIYVVAIGKLHSVLLGVLTRLTTRALCSHQPNNEITVPYNELGSR